MLITYEEKKNVSAFQPEIDVSCMVGEGGRLHVNNQNFIGSLNGLVKRQRRNEQFISVTRNF